MRIRTLPYTLSASLLLASANAAALPPPPQGPIRVQILDPSVSDGLQVGRNTGGFLTCTAFGVFLSPPFLMFVFGLMILAALVVVGLAYVLGGRSDGATRPLVILGIAVFLVGLLAFLFHHIMGCGVEHMPRTIGP